MTTMNKIEKTLVIFLIIFAALAVGLTFNTVSLNSELTSTKDELNITYTTLESVKDELAAVKENYENEIEKTNNLASDLETANTIIESLKSEEYVVGFTVTNYEIELLAKTVWGEARGTNKMEQSAVVWCVLNRVDAGWGTIAEVITAPNQFHGYSSNFPVTDEIRELVEDVIARWKMEKVCGGNVGRTLPSNYLFFRADSTGLSNIFRTEWNGPYEVWDWDCWNPYS